MLTHLKEHFLTYIALICLSIVWYISGYMHAMRNIEKEIDIQYTCVKKNHAN